MYERFTARARKVMQLANQEAQRLNHSEIRTSHMLLGLIRDESGLGGAALLQLGATLEKARQAVERITTSVPGKTSTQELPKTPATQRMLGRATSEAYDLKHHHVGTEHLLLSLLREDASGASVLRDMGLSVEEVRAEVLSLFDGGKSNDEAKVCDPLKFVIQWDVRMASSFSRRELCQMYNALIARNEKLKQQTGSFGPGVVAFSKQERKVCSAAIEKVAGLLAGVAK